MKHSLTSNACVMANHFCGIPASPSTLAKHTAQCLWPYCISRWTFRSPRPNVVGYEIFRFFIKSLPMCRIRRFHWNLDRGFIHATSARARRSGFPDHPFVIPQELPGHSFRETLMIQSEDPNHLLKIQGPCFFNFSYICIYIYKHTPAGRLIPNDIT